MGITRDLAHTALSVKLEDLPDAVMLQAKRLVVDAFACIVGGFQSPTGHICRDLAHQLNGPGQATIVGENVQVGLRDLLVPA